MEEPQHRECEGKSKKERTEQRMSKSVVRSKAKKILEIWSEGTHQQSRSYKTEASKRQSGGTVG